MNKIGIKVTRISAGFQDLVVFNEGEWTRKVSDLRSYTKEIEGEAFDNGSPVLLLSFTTSASMLTLTRVIPGRSGDQVSAWIHIPSTISITADEELTIIEKVKAEIVKPYVDNWDTLGEICNKEYPQKQPMPYRESMATGACAVRYYDEAEGGLRNLLGDRLYQSYYADHRFVFLLDRNSGITADDKLVNYTDEPFQEYIVLTPPVTPPGVIARLNGAAFTAPMRAVKGNPISFTLERPGFNTLKWDISAGDPLPDISQAPWTRHITPDLFRVYDNEGRDCGTSCHILLNGKRLTPAGLDLPEEECNAVKVETECPGCEPGTDMLNLLLPPPFQLTLEREKLDVVYLIDGKECPGLTECPKGYTYTDIPRGKKIYRDCRYAEPDKRPNWKLLSLIIGGAALILGLAVGIIVHKAVAKTKKTDQIENKENVPNTEKKNKNDNQGTSTPARGGTVYACLNNKIWKKSEIEKDPALKGFYEDVLLCKVNNLTQKWKTKIDTTSHEYWAKLLHSVESAAEKCGDTKLAQDFQLDKNYTQIDVEDYIKRLGKFVADNTAATSTQKKDKPKTKPTVNKDEAGHNEVNSLDEASEVSGEKRKSS